MSDQDQPDEEASYPFDEYEEDQGDDEYGIWDSEIEILAARTDAR